MPRSDPRCPGRQSGSEAPPFTLGSGVALHFTAWLSGSCLCPGLGMWFLPGPSSLTAEGEGSMLSTQGWSSPLPTASQAHIRGGPSRPAPWEGLPGQSPPAHWGLVHPSQGTVPVSSPSSYISETQHTLKQT